MNNNKKNIEQEKANKQNWWNKLLGLNKTCRINGFILIFICIFMFYDTNVIFASVENKKNNTDFFQKIETSYPVIGNPVKLKDGRILITGGKKNLIFNPKTNEFKEIANPFHTISYLDGRLLNTNKVLFNSPFWKYPSELFSSYGYIREEMEREEIAKTAHLRPTGMSITDYRQKQKDKARENYAKLPEETKGNIFRKYNKNNPELLKKYNDYVERYEKSLYAQLYNPDTDK